MNTLLNETVGSLVAKNYRASAVFAQHGIDFCCKGGRTLSDACQISNLNAEKIEKELLEVLEQKETTGPDFNAFPLDLLVDYIEKKHHRYVAEKIPMLKMWLDKLCDVHGERHPELFEIRDHFFASATELSNHMKKEELILFPVIRRMEQAKFDKRKVETPPFGTVRNPVSMMMHEHDNEGERFRKIAAISDNYTPPADACTTYRVAFETLKEFEADLHHHIHLENNILFPKAIELETEMV